MFIAKQRLDKHVPTTTNGGHSGYKNSGRRSVQVDVRSRDCPVEEYDSVSDGDL
jgi:hypothetical protein